jgi:hypothetical protein
MTDSKKVTKDKKDEIHNISSEKDVKSSNAEQTQSQKNYQIEEIKKDQSQDQESEIIELDPTHFGDWQIKGRAIDFS